ncbi:MAG: N-(5'-phosphoribosyl)anthranilate isomerase, partial [Myxococcales bacterium]|nr:N-(5'-phosphoribosyl)anthranilate isomerase [Myxococcales bacterium]
MRAMVVKICGVTRAADAEAAAAAGADWIGLNFWSRSRRRVTVEQAQEVARAIP